MKLYLFSILLLVLVRCSPPNNIPKDITNEAASAEKVQICMTCHVADGKHDKKNVLLANGRFYRELVAIMRKV
jgi:cytochrome c553